MLVLSLFPGIGLLDMAFEQVHGSSEPGPEYSCSRRLPSLNIKTSSLPASPAKGAPDALQITGSRGSKNPSTTSGETSVSSANCKDSPSIS